MKPKGPLFSLAKNFKDAMPKPPYDTVKFESITKEIGEWIAANEEVLLLAWFAQYGFEPGKAVLVRGFNLETGQFELYIREATPEEMEKRKR